MSPKYVWLVSILAMAVSWLAVQVESAGPRDPLKSKPTWQKTFGSSATLAFFVLDLLSRLESGKVDYLDKPIPTIAWQIAFWRERHYEPDNANRV